MSVLGWSSPLLGLCFRVYKSVGLKVEPVLHCGLRDYIGSVLRGAEFNRF